jgi:hypothetical protein
MESVCKDHAYKTKAQIVWFLDTGDLEAVNHPQLLLTDGTYQPPACWCSSIILYA